MRKSISTAFFSLVSTLMVLGIVLMGCSEWVLFKNYFARDRYETLDQVVGVTRRTAQYLAQQAALPEGSYDVTLSYAGDADILLPFTQGQLIVRGGQTTKVELAAASRMGRIVMQAESGRAVSGGAVSYASEETGEVYGPYAMDADGLAVSDPLPAGVYRVEEITAPKNTQIGETNNETICVEAGQAAQVSVRLLTLENQRFAMVRAEIDDTGARQETALNEPLTAELLTADGGRQTADDVQIQDGGVSLEALSGTYVLRLKATRRGWAFCRSPSRSRCPAARRRLPLRRRRRGWCCTASMKTATRLPERRMT